MSVQDYWYLEKLVITTEDGTKEITEELLEAIERTQPFEELTEDFYATLMAFNMLLHFEEDGTLTVLLMLDDDELEDPDYRDRFEITEDGCAVLGHFRWTQNGDTVYVEAEFLRHMLSEQFFAVTDDEPQPVRQPDDDTLVLADTLYFSRLKEL